MLLDAPPIVLDGVQALRQPDLFAFEILHPVDLVAGADHHAAAFVRRVRHPQQHGPAQVRLNVDRGEQTAEADQVVHVVDVVRIPVVPALGAKEGVLDADLLVFLTGPTEFLIDIAGRDEGAIGVVNFLPIQGNRV